MEKIDIKHRNFPCEALNQTRTGDNNFRKLEEDAEEHRAKSTFLIWHKDSIDENTTKHARFTLA